MQKQQYKIMQWMMVMMGLFFYKVAAGLCVYFICSSLWSLTERKLIPKPKVKPGLPEVLPGPDAAGGSATTAGGGGFMARLRARVEEMQKQAEAQAARQIRNDPTDRRNNKKKRK
jgi:membrane protein insertase Oxa1/YidC/SpoIIIJ